MKIKQKKTKVLQIRLNEKDYQDFEILKRSTGKSISQIILDNKDYYYTNLRKRNMLVENQEQLNAKNDIAKLQGFNTWEEMQKTINLNWLEE